jgi:hypothetical protein
VSKPPATPPTKANKSEAGVCGGLLDNECTDCGEARYPWCFLLISALVPAQERRLELAGHPWNIPVDDSSGVLNSTAGRCCRLHSGAGFLQLFR